MSDPALGDDVSLAGNPRKKRARTFKVGGPRDTIDPRPKGSSTLSDLMQWPDWVVDVVSADPALQSNLRSILDRPVVASSSYSSLDAPRECLQQLSTAWEAKRGRPLTLDFRCACDKAPVPQSVLLHLAQTVDASESCVFADIEDRLNQETRSLLDSMMPHKEATREEKKAAFSSMQGYILVGQLHGNLQSVCNLSLLGSRDGMQSISGCK